MFHERLGAQRVPVTAHFLHLSAMPQRMPIFMDTHQGTEMPAELRRTVESRVRSGERDAHGVIDRGVIFDHDAGTMHCVLDAADRDAVRRHHETLKVPLDERSVHQADAILR